MTPTRLHECPVCGQRFRDARGRGGHLATKQDPAHIAHRLHADPPRDPRSLAPSTPTPPPPVTVPAPTPTPQPASTPSTRSEPHAAPAAGSGLDVQAMLDHYANIWANPATDAPVEAPRFEVPELEDASPFVRGLFIILTILASGFGLYFLVQSKRGANTPQNASRTLKPAAPTTDESEAYWRNLLGNAAIHNPRRRGGSGGWP